MQKAVIFHISSQLSPLALPTFGTICNCRKDDHDFIRWLSLGWPPPKGMWVSMIIYFASCVWAIMLLHVAVAVVAVAVVACCCCACWCCMCWNFEVRIIHLVPCLSDPTDADWLTQTQSGCLGLWRTRNLRVQKPPSCSPSFIQSGTQNWAAIFLGILINGVKIFHGPLVNLIFDSLKVKLDPLAGHLGPNDPSDFRIETSRPFRWLIKCCSLQIKPVEKQEWKTIDSKNPNRTRPANYLRDKSTYDFISQLCSKTKSLAKDISVN